MIMLDTHAVVWWVSDPERIPARARRRIEASAGAGEGIAVSSISFWEIAMLVTLGRLRLTIPLEVWLANLEGLAELRFVAVSNQVALRAVLLDQFPSRDPADRIIVATAMMLGATLLTADRRLRSYRVLETAWT